MADNRISSITVRGFKSVCSSQTIQVKPLTLLAGANSSGKSTILQPLLLLKQTLEAAGDPGALLLNGPNVTFTSTDQLMSRGARSTKGVNFGMSIGLLEGEWIEIEFAPITGVGFDVVRMVYSDEHGRVEVRRGMSNEEIHEVLPRRYLELPKRISPKERNTVWSVWRDRCFLSLGFEVEEQEGMSLTRSFGYPATWKFVPFIQGAIHLPGLRGNPQRTYPKMAAGPSFPGRFEQYVASVIAQWQSEKNDKIRDLGRALEMIGLTWKVKAERVDDTQVALKVGRKLHGKQGGAHDLVNITDVGFGVSQCLPVIVALLAAAPGQLVYLEQPEIHLHPLAQRRLADILCSAARRGAVVVAETHSSLLLREIQRLVAIGEMEKESVALHWFARDDDGFSTVTTGELDETGAFGDWPEDFDLTELQLEREYLDAVEVKGRS